MLPLVTFAGIREIVLGLHTKIGIDFVLAFGK